MLFENTFYTIQKTQRNDDEVLYDIRLNPGHEMFQGHFPNNPVTPGVVQMEVVKELLSLNLDQKAQVKTISNCKFLAVLNPNEHPEVHVKISVSSLEGNFVKVQSSISFAEKVFFKLSGVYALTDATNEL